MDPGVGRVWKETHAASQGPARARPPAGRDLLAMPSSVSTDALLGCSIRWARSDSLSILAFPILACRALAVPDGPLLLRAPLHLHVLSLGRALSLSLCRHVQEVVEVVALILDATIPGSLPVQLK